ncbi:MAG: 1-(5-phosphoribosyl)-5-[(5-phosphoribosylamino)methylideneamino]imidazole-4-carboxamide isomerase [Flavipsychrobacter sp.]
MIEIIPAIDIIEGKCVRLSQGNFSRQTIYQEKPIDIAKKIEASGIGRIHLVDLDGAKAGRIINIRTLEEIANQTNLIIDFGGGIKTDADLFTVLSAGAQIANIGSIAVQKPDIILKWLAKYGKEKLLIGADVVNKSIAINGWQQITDLDIFDFIGRFYKEGMRQFFCTDIQKDGMLLGPSTELYKDIIQRFPHISLIASGGISSIKDIEQLQSIGCAGAIVGKAWHEGIITNTSLKSNS